MHEIRAPWGLALLGAKLDGQCEDGFYDWAVDSAHQATEIRLSINDLQRWEGQVLRSGVSGSSEGLARRVALRVGE
jgi:hypothetical protein